MVWFSALKLGLNAATHIYKKKQETKMAMADAQHMHASKIASIYGIKGTQIFKNGKK
jgi:hypothetical protein